MKLARRQMWDTYALSGMNAHLAGNYTQAESMWFAALEEASDFAETDSRFICALENLMQVYWLQKKYQDAENVCMRLLPIYERLCGSYHQSVGNIAHKLASINHTLGRTSSAKRFYKKALGIKLRTLSPEHPEVASILDACDDLSAISRIEDKPNNWMRSERRNLTCVDSETGEEPAQTEVLSPARITISLTAKPLFQKLVEFNRTRLQEAS